MLTLSCLVAPPCTLVLLIVCKRKSLPWHHQRSRLRSLLLLKGSTLSGSAVLSWHPCQLSNRCGSPSRNTTNLVLALFTENVSKLLTFTIENNNAALLQRFMYVITFYFTFICNNNIDNIIILNDKHVLALGWNLSMIV